MSKDKLVKWEPKGQMTSLFDHIFGPTDLEFKSLWDIFQSTWGNVPRLRGSGVFTPRMDIEETETSYVVKADLPGLTKEDIKVDVSDGVLMIKGERKVEKEDKTKTYYTVERQYGMFERAFEIPNVIEENIKATFKDGVLEIVLPKSEESKKKELTIKVE